MTDDEFFRALAARIEPFLTHSVPPSPPSPPAPPIIPVPVPVPVPAGISSRWDSAPSQWAKWNFITAAETTALAALYGVTVAQHINWYQSYHRLDGLQKADKTYWFVNGYTAWGTPNWAQDIGGAADAKHRADLGSVPEIPPLG